MAPMKKNDMDTVGKVYSELDFKNNPTKKGKLRIMPVSDSPWAPTGFGTNTKNIACIFQGEGHHIGYGGCQNPRHAKWTTPWPLGQTEKEAEMELLPIMYMGQEKFGERSFPAWIETFQPNLVFGHLDFQMFKHISDSKNPEVLQLPIRAPNGKMLNRKQRMQIMNDAYKQISKGTKWKFACIVPYDGQPTVPQWQYQTDSLDYGISMARYGQIGLKQDFNLDTTYIPHGVDTNLFKPIMKPKYGSEDKPDAFIVGCVARNQHRKNIPRLVKGFAQFVKQNNLSPDQAKLILHMDWNDAMGWKFPDFATYYGVEDYLMPPLMGVLDHGEAISEEDMANLYNCMDVFVLPTGGEGFGIPTLEAMSCGVPVCATNYTTSYELIKCEDASKEDVPMYPLGGHHNDPMPNGRDELLEEDICERGILLPYKDMWWDTPNRAAPQRAICSENAIAQALDYYYKNPAKKLAAGKAARAHAIKYYSWEVIGQKWKDWIQMVSKDIKK